MIVAVLGGGGYFAWTKLEPLIASRRAPSPSPVVEATPTPAPTSSPTPAPSETPAPQPTESASTVLDPSLFISAAPSLPSPSTTDRLLVTPPTSARPVMPPTESVRLLDSESEVIKAVERGEAAAGLVSVVSLAGHPEAIRRGVRAAWYHGEWPREGLLSSCDAEQLRSQSLGVVRLSVPHYELLRLFAGTPLPEVTLFSDPATLQDAATKKEITGGDSQIAESADARGCPSLTPGAAHYVVIHNLDAPLSLAELRSMLGSLQVDENAARGFLFGDTSPFARLFDSAAKVWTRLALIDAPARAADAIDLRFVEPRSQVPSTPAPGSTPAPARPPDASAVTPRLESPAAPKYGYPSSVFDF